MWILANEVNRTKYPEVQLWRDEGFVPAKAKTKDHKRKLFKVVAVKNSKIMFVSMFEKNNQTISKEVIHNHVESPSKI